MTIKQMLNFDISKKHWFYEKWNSEVKEFWSNKQLQWYDQWKDKKLQGFSKGWYTDGTLWYHKLYKNDNMVKELIYD